MGENTDTIHVEDVIRFQETKLFEQFQIIMQKFIVGKITSSQTMSEDIQYIVTSNEKVDYRLKHLKQKKRKNEKKLNRLEVETIRESVASMYLFNLNSEHYNQIPLTELPFMKRNHSLIYSTTNQ